MGRGSALIKARPFYISDCSCLPFLAWRLPVYELQTAYFLLYETVQIVFFHCAVGCSLYNPVLAHSEESIDSTMSSLFFKEGGKYYCLLAAILFKLLMVRSS